MIEILPLRANIVSASFADNVITRMLDGFSILYTQYGRVGSYLNLMSTLSPCTTLDSK